MKADFTADAGWEGSGAKPALSACLIVRNEAHCLARCLESIKGFVSEIIIVDTGSTDGTVAVARRYTDKIFHHEWNDHFAEARNVALSQATGDWILVIDADEVLPAETAELVPDYVRLPEFQGRPLILNWHILSFGTPAIFKRGLFPNGWGIEFAGRVHETAVLPGQEIASYHCPELMVQHIRSETEADKKQRYYQRLLQQSLTEETELARLNHIQKHLGLNHLALEEWRSAWSILASCYQGMQRRGVRPQDGFYGEVLRGLVQAGDQLGYPEARRYLQELHAHFPSEPVPKGLLPAKAKPSIWQKVLIAGSLSTLAACQASPTAPLSQAISPGVTSSVSSPESPEALRARYGPFARIGIEYPEFKDYLSQSRSDPLPGASSLLSAEDFRVKGYDFSQCSGTYGDFTYSSIGSIRDAQLQCEDTITYSNFSAVEGCYAQGGVPVWVAHQICTAQGPPDGSFCFTTTEEAELLACNGLSPTPTPPPPGPSGGGSGFPPPSSADWSLTLDKEWFSPNGDGVKDTVRMLVSSKYPWQVNIKKAGQILKQYNGQSSEIIEWDGAEANGQEGKYNIVLVPPRKQNLEKDNKVVGIDLTPPVITPPLRHSNAQGRDELDYSVQDPLSNGVRSGIDPQDVHYNLVSNTINIASPVAQVRSDAKIDYTAQLTDLPIQVAGLWGGGFQTASLTSGFRALSTQTSSASSSQAAGNSGDSSIQAMDKAGNSVRLDLDFNGSMCIANNTREKLKKAYEDIVGELDKLITEIQKPATQASVPFQTTSLGQGSDFTIQAIVKCEPGECETPIIAERLVDHARSLTKIELATANRAAQDILAGEVQMAVVDATLKTAGSAGLFFIAVATPIGVEIGATTLALEMAMYMEALSTTSPYILAYLLVNNTTYHALLDLLVHFKNISTEALKALNNTTHALCMKPEQVRDGFRFQRGMVDFTKKFTGGIKKAASNILNLGQDFKILNPKILIEGDGYFYTKNPLNSMETQGVLHISKIEGTEIKPPNINNAPEQHEVESALFLASEGRYIHLANKNFDGPDLKIGTLVKDAAGKVVTNPDGSVVVPNNLETWDLKALLNTLPENAKKAFVDQLRSSASKKDLYFTSLNLPYKLVVDVKRYFNKAQMTEFINAIKAGTAFDKPAKNADAIKYLSQLDELALITSDGLMKVIK